MCCNERSRMTQLRPKTAKKISLKKQNNTPPPHSVPQCQEDSFVLFSPSIPVSLGTFSSLCLFCYLFLRSTHTSVQSESSHSLGQSSFLQACWEASLGAEQKVSGSSRKLPSAMRCLQRTSRFWMPPPQVLEHWGRKRKQILHKTVACLTVSPILTLALAYCRVRKEKIGKKTQEPTQRKLFPHLEMNFVARSISSTQS